MLYEAVPRVGLRVWDMPGAGGMPLATLFAVTACATGSSVLLFRLLPSRAQLQRVAPLPAAAKRRLGVPVPTVASADVTAVLRLIRRSPKLRWVLVAFLARGPPRGSRGQAMLDPCSELQS
jgi:hypothetical protein